MTTMNTTEKLRKHALSVPEILLPNSMIDLAKWAVIACDQYTQDRDYWKNIEQLANGTPSTLSLIFPEVYLEDSGRTERIQDIHRAMHEYLDPAGANVFATPLHGCIYLERTTAYGRVRKGLVTAIDLEAYDWKPDTTAMIRATEATIVDRIPPRMEIRRGAPLELPHIMLLVNDPDKTLVERSGARVRNNKPCYDTRLEPEAGHITGWAVSSEEDLASLADAVESIGKANTCPDGSCFLFAVGDGNHSLATAKAVWEEYREANGLTGETAERHPARYALIEIVNIHDDGLTFEPIHRVLFGADPGELTQFVQEKLGGTLSVAADESELEQQVASRTTTCFGFVSPGAKTVLESPDPALAVSRLQPVLDEFVAAHAGVTMDYIHGTDEVFRLGKKDGAVAILLPPVEKSSFFSTIAATGPLPRKSFSMGEASEKRYYLECRKLFS